MNSERPGDSADRQGDSAVIDCVQTPAYCACCKQKGRQSHRYIYFNLIRTALLNIKDKTASGRMAKKGIGGSL